MAVVLWFGYFLADANRSSHRPGRALHGHYSDRLELHRCAYHGRVRAGRSLRQRLALASDPTRLRLSVAGLPLVVRDDGLGAKDAGPALLGKGLGLSATAERLQQLYGDRQTFTIENVETGGLQISILIPCRTEAPEILEGVQT